MSEREHIEAMRDFGYRVKRDLPIEEEPRFVDEASIARRVAEAMARETEEES